MRRAGAIAPTAGQGALAPMQVFPRPHCASGWACCGATPGRLLCPVFGGGNNCETGRASSHSSISGTRKPTLRPDSFRGNGKSPSRTSFCTVETESATYSAALTKSSAPGFGAICRANSPGTADFAMLFSCFMCSQSIPIPDEKAGRRWRQGKALTRSFPPMCMRVQHLQRRPRGAFRAHCHRSGGAAKPPSRGSP